MSSINNNINR